MPLPLAMTSVKVSPATLLVKQHAVIDIAAGLALSALDYVLIYVIVARRRDKLANPGIDGDGRV